MQVFWPPCLGLPRAVDSSRQWARPRLTLAIFPVKDGLIKGRRQALGTPIGHHILMNNELNFDKEIAELKQFIIDLKEERQAQKDKEKRESWTKYTSLSIVFIAVLAAVASQYAGKFSGKTLVSLNSATYFQAKASDQWSFYQAKSIKQNLYEVERDQLSIHPGGENGAKAGVTETNGNLGKKIEMLGSKIDKYDKEKADIKAEAEKLEHERDKARKEADEASSRGARMGSIVALYQISIALGSVSLLTKKKNFWFISLFLATLGTLVFAPILML
jgi:hypothetical protein